eukprot:CAMPEP_0185785920 /NCGR_PEP_ID=MMETSP1174-20130828/132432_1 /TAXON_ID=35687 /ORGANISM="Dictyocha speculum, Strain CCMP1381" /LENGTH=78 /DNA_ID=CAMNT_0028478263 /DNA_START=545 /DNA_END=782 /DNA_ORIENTATION=-
MDGCRIALAMIEVGLFDNLKDVDGMGTEFPVFVQEEVIEMNIDGVSDVAVFVDLGGLCVLDGDVDAFLAALSSSSGVY